MHRETCMTGPVLFRVRLVKRRGMFLHSLYYLHNPAGYYKMKKNNPG